MLRRIVPIVLLAAAGSVYVRPAAGADACLAEMHKSAWIDAMFAECQRQAAKGPSALARRPLPDFGRSDFTVTAWIRTTSGGTILAKAPDKGIWVRHGKSLFVKEGRVCFDVGWVGCTTSRRSVADGQWHHVSLVCQRGRQTIFIDGQSAATGRLGSPSDGSGWVVKIGRTSDDFGGDFHGLIDEVCLYARALSADEIKTHAQTAEAGQTAADSALAGYWPMEGDGRDASGSNNAASLSGRCEFADGRHGKALKLAGHSCAVVRGLTADPLAEVWTRVEHDFSDPASRNEMAWEREDGIWDGWTPGDWAALARRYAAASRRLTSVDKGPAAKAGAVNDRQGLLAVRQAYLEDRRHAEALQALSEFDLPGLRAMIRSLGDSCGARYPNADKHLAEVAELENQAVASLKGTGPCLRPTSSQKNSVVGPKNGPVPEPSLDAKGTGPCFRPTLSSKSNVVEPKNGPVPVSSWIDRVTALRRQALVADNPLLDFGKLVFVKRPTYSSNHYYTEYINSAWLPGGNLCVLDMKDGSVRELAPQLPGGVFERFDLSFDARRVVFAWKAGPQVGYRIYEVNVDGTGLRQLTFPPPDEDELVKKYRVYAHYHHGTDDMQPCYLPDGDIAFISTRCQYGILCDSPDDFTTTVLYRMDADGRNLRKLTNSSVSEASPVMLPDGRLLYTRWEYVDKGAVSVKCLWAMRPDGTASSEIYGNDVALPPTLIYGRPIPDAPNRYVVCGTPHCPQNGVGTVIRLDMNKNIRTREPMTYMTPCVDVRAEGGFAFHAGDGPWRGDGNGRGPLFKDPYPLSEKLFLVAHKPEGPAWNDPKGYGLYLLDEEGRTQLIYRDPEMSCWLPYPLKTRRVPPVLSSDRDPELARSRLAVCMVSDVYHGLKDVPRGTIKYLRVLEQIPRPWAARRRWGGDEYDQQHACITKDTHLGLKVQHGVVPVEEDGSASVVVPAESNIFLQVLDANYMAVQTERTYVNYMPGETRSCVGCHETPNQTAAGAVGSKKAMLRPPSVPGPQPGETAGRRPLDYAADVQPVWNKYCLECHSGTKLDGGLDLSGRLTTMFNVSYESLVPERRKGFRDRKLLGPVIGENHPKTGNVDYLPARSLGSHASVLVAMLSPGAVRLADPAQAERAAKLAEAHRQIRLRPEELLKVTNWVDTNCQYYGTYWGRKNVQFRSRPDFRPVPTFDMATRMTSPFPEGK